MNKEAFLLGYGVKSDYPAMRKSAFIKAYTAGLQKQAESGAQFSMRPSGKVTDYSGGAYTKPGSVAGFANNTAQGYADNVANLPRNTINAAGTVLGKGMTSVMSPEAAHKTLNYIQHPFDTAKSDIKSGIKSMTPSKETILKTMPWVLGGIGALGLGSMLFGGGGKGQAQGQNMPGGGGMYYAGPTKGYIPRDQLGIGLQQGTPQEMNIR